MGSVFIAGGKPAMEAPVAGVPAGGLAVGSSIWLSENGTLAEYLVVNQGIPSESTLYDESCNGVWLLRKDCYEKRQWHSSDSNNYKIATIHSYMNSAFLSLFDDKTKTVIKQVKIPYVNGTGNSAVASGENGLSAKIFLLSGCEVGQEQNTGTVIDGACLSYFSKATSSNLIAYLDGAKVLWWLRSPFSSSTIEAWLVLANGYYSRYNCSLSYGIRPALVLPSDCKLTDNGEGKLILA